MRRAQAGDRQAFDELQTRFRPVIVEYLHRRTRDRETAEDLTQDTFLRAWQALPRSGRQTPQHFRGWLFRIATNLFIDLARRHQLVRQAALSAALRPEETWTGKSGAAAPSGDPEQHVLDREGEAAIWARLDDLVPAARVALCLWAEGLDCGEIAQVLGRTRGAVKALMRRARSRLRHQGHVQ